MWIANQLLYSLDTHANQEKNRTNLIKNANGQIFMGEVNKKGLIM